VTRRRTIGAAIGGFTALGVALLVGYRWSGPGPGGDEGVSDLPSLSPTAPAGLTAPAQTVPDLAYADASAAQQLDLHLPARHGTAVPLVIVIHGGAFAAGDKADEPTIVAAVTAAGWAAATINYRLSGEARFPAGVQDAQASVRWLRARAGQYGLDPDRFAVWGTSAGGHLAAMIGVSGSAGPVGVSGSAGSVQAVVDWFGPTDFLTMDQQNVDPGGCPAGAQAHDPADSPESRWLGAAVQTVPALAEKASPISYLDAGHPPPPFFIAHGKRDCIVPVGQSEQLSKALQAVGGAVTLNVVTDAGHADPLIYRTQTIPAIAFLRRIFTG
jgi:acetyl esterase/lipase